MTSTQGNEVSGLPAWRTLRGLSPAAGSSVLIFLRRRGPCRSIDGSEAASAGKPLPPASAAQVLIGGDVSPRRVTHHVRLRSYPVSSSLVIISFSFTPNGQQDRAGGRINVCLSASTCHATSSPAAPDVATSAAPPPLVMRLSARMGRKRRGFVWGLDGLTGHRLACPADRAEPAACRGLGSMPDGRAVPPNAMRRLSSGAWIEMTAPRSKNGPPAANPGASVGPKAFHWVEVVTRGHVDPTQGATPARVPS